MIRNYTTFIDAAVTDATSQEGSIDPTIFAKGIASLEKNLEPEFKGTLLNTGITSAALDYIAALDLDVNARARMVLELHRESYVFNSRNKSFEAPLDKS